jgi:integrase
MSCDKKPTMDIFTLNKKFGINFNPVTAIPRLVCAEYIGERYLSFDEVSKLLMDARTGKYFKRALGLFIELTFFCCGQRPYELMSAKKEYYDRKFKMLFIQSETTKTQKMVSLCFM